MLKLYKAKMSAAGKLYFILRTPGFQYTLQKVHNGNKINAFRIIFVQNIEVGDVAETRSFLYLNRNT